MPTHGDNGLRAGFCAGLCAWLQRGRAFLDDEGMRGAVEVVVGSVRRAVTMATVAQPERRHRRARREGAFVVARAVRCVVTETPGLTTGEIAKHVLALNSEHGTRPNVHPALAYGLRVGLLRREGAWGARRYYPAACPTPATAACGTRTPGTDPS